jgi:hypothetical protein
LYGARGFDYAGKYRHDMAVWAGARSAIVVSSSPALLARARAVAEVQEVVPDERAGPLAYLKMIRVHQWLKNLLIFLPMVAAHRLGSADSLLKATLAFAALSLCARVVYVINDLLVRKQTATCAQAQPPARRRPDSGGACDRRRAAAARRRAGAGAAPAAGAAARARRLLRDDDGVFAAPEAPGDR